MHGLKLDLSHLRLGVATAAAQIEGGDFDSNWNRICKRGLIKDGSDISRANQHWEKMEEDIALLEEMGIRAYRMSLSWSRLEPKEGVFSAEALAHYRRELSLLREKKIHVCVTLHHFSHPGWFEDKGAFTKIENVDDFLRFVEYAVRGLGDLADDYISINEPNVFATSRYYFGEWGSDVKSGLSMAVHCLNVLAAAHLRAYQLIHRIRAEKGWPASRVSIANHVRPFDPARPYHPLDRFSSRFMDFFFNRGVEDAFYRAHFRFPFVNLSRIPQGRYTDAIAVNYYTRGMARGIGELSFPNTPKNDLGWDIYPEGIVRVLRDLKTREPDLPVWITENGTCDNQDQFRCRYLYDHLKALAESGLSVETYYHWCFLDNFEWLEGETARFGLVHCDYETQQRRIKKSGQFYAQMIRDGGVTEAAYETYVAGQNYKLR